MCRHATRSGAIPEKHWRAWAAAHLGDSEALDNRMGVREAALNGIVVNHVHGLLPFGLEAGMASALLGERRESNVGARDARRLKRSKVRFACNRRSSRSD
jgi:hypothetical protein